MLKSLTLLVSLLFVSGTVLAESSKELLAQAITVSNSINSNLTVEKKLEKYEHVQRIVDKIIVDHPGTDEGIKLLSGEAVGNFDYATIQDNYIKELTDYYDTVCKVSPSFTCIAFVSLQQGVQSCKASADFSSLDAAHKEILNALDIFTSQDAKEQYLSLALNAYRGCLSSSKVKVKPAIQDYFSSNLVPFFISQHQPDAAKAIVQQMDDPYLKFAAVIELSKASDKGLTRDYIERMQKYAYEKLSSNKMSQNLALFKLKTELLAQNDFSLSKEQDLWSDMGGDLGFILRAHSIGRDVTCSEVYNKSFFTAVINLLDISMIRSAELNVDRPGYNANRILQNMRFDAVSEFLDACASKTDGKDYALAIDIYTRIGFFDYAEGNKFLNNAAMFNYDTDKMMEYYFVFENQHPEVVELTHGIEDAFAKPSESKGYVSNIYDQYFRFKKHVVNGQMCDAIDMLFKELKGGQDYNRAISYLIESSDVDRSKKYECGDAELEMLLN